MRILRSELVLAGLLRMEIRRAIIYGVEYPRGVEAGVMDEAQSWAHAVASV